MYYFHNHDFKVEDAVNLSTIPAGDWTLGRLKEPECTCGKLVFDSRSEDSLDWVTAGPHAGPHAGPLWYSITTPTDIRYVEVLRSRYRGPFPVDDIQSPHHTLAKLVVNPYGYPQVYNNHSYALAIGIWSEDKADMKDIARENQIYSHLQGCGIAAPFLGHIMAVGPGMQTIGFLVAYLPQRREACKGVDLEGCKEVLRRLHARGIVYGDRMTPHSFLVGRF